MIFYYLIPIFVLFTAFLAISVILSFYNHKIRQTKNLIFYLIQHVSMRELMVVFLVIFRDKVYLFCGGKLNSLKLEKTGEKIYRVLTYHHNSKQYKIRWETRTGPSKILKVTDFLGNDITSNIKEFMGIDEKFHGALVTPNTMGFHELNFLTMAGKTHKFKGNQTVMLVF